MLLKLLPLLAAIVVGVRILARFAAANANRKRMAAERAGRLDQYNADREAFWRKIDQISLVLFAALAVWYAIGIIFWLSGR